MSRIYDIVNETARQVGDEWVGKRSEPRDNDRRIRDSVIQRLNDALPFQEVVILCARDVERLAVLLSDVNTVDDIQKIVDANPMPEITTLLGLTKALNDAAHKLWQEQYKPLESKL